MDPKEQISDPEDPIREIDGDMTSSVEDFIRELEAKERDLHITSDLSIEIADADEDHETVPDFVMEEIGSPAVANAQAAAASKVSNFELENEIAALKLKVFELRNERNEIQEKSDRRLKDFENFKYRVDRERRGAFIDQIANLGVQMLPVLDNLNRALDVSPAELAGRTPEFKHLFDGLVLVNQQMNEVFAGMGVISIPAMGERFDPNFHEAVAMEERDDLEPNIIIDEMLRGYRIGNRVIRHSMVRVSAPKAAPKASEEASEDLSPETDVSESEAAE
ncbi:MAG: nucleotide exchange factor GrpE [Chloracidobacterium sp.]|nr:nucleotide exchange factor GrpE [Chloracidobacterium sp.]MCO5333139.1 nucleotide exchange factor GrpE [Pyrinomonadaceae bacterium]